MCHVWRIPLSCYLHEVGACGWCSLADAAVNLIPFRNAVACLRRAPSSWEGEDAPTAHVCMHAASAFGIHCWTMRLTFSSAGGVVLLSSSLARRYTCMVGLAALAMAQSRGWVSMQRPYGYVLARTQDSLKPSTRHSLKCAGHACTPLAGQGSPGAEGRHAQAHEV